MGKTRDFFKKIRDTKGTFHAKMGQIKDRNGMDLTEEGEGVLSPHIFFETIFGYIQTEDGDNLTTESGDRLVL